MSEQLFVKVRDGERGPFPTEQLAKFLSQGKLRPNTLVRAASSETWQRLEAVLTPPASLENSPHPRLTEATSAAPGFGNSQNPAPTTPTASGASASLAVPPSHAPDATDDEYRLADDLPTGVDPSPGRCPHCASPVEKRAARCVQCGYHFSKHGGGRRETAHAAPQIATASSLTRNAARLGRGAGPAVPSFMAGRRTPSHASWRTVATGLQLAQLSAMTIAAATALIVFLAINGSVGVLLDRDLATMLCVPCLAVLLLAHLVWLVGYGLCLAAPREAGVDRYRTIIPGLMSLSLAPLAAVAGTSRLDPRHPHSPLSLLGGGVVQRRSLGPVPQYSIARRSAPRSHWARSSSPRCSWRSRGKCGACRARLDRR